MAQQPQLILSGSLAVDQIMNFDGLFADMIKPDALRVLSISVLIKELRRTRGGIAGNIAYSLALLGEKPVLLASVGQEQRAYMDELAALGVNTSQVHYSHLPTATFSVITDRDDCQVGGFYPGAMSDAQSLSFTKLQRPEDLAVISAHDPTQMAVQINECAATKQRLFFDVGQQVIMLPVEVLRAGLAAAELLIINDYEMATLSERLQLSSEQIVQLVDTCVVTLGEQGCRWHHRSEHWQPVNVPAVTVKQVVDPTGAGDAFRAGFLYGYVRGWEGVECCQLGATVAAYAVEHLGTQEHRFTPAEVGDRYQQQYGQRSKLVG